MAEEILKFADGSGINSSNAVVRDAGMQPNASQVSVPNLSDQSRTIPVNEIGNNTQALKFPLPPPTTNPIPGMAAGAKESVKSLEKFLAPEAPSKGKYDAMVADFATLLPGLGGRGEAQVQAEADAGIPDLKKNLSNLNSLILAKVAEAEKANANYEAEIARIETQPGMLTSIATGQQGAIRKLQLAEANKRSSDINLLQARALGAQGELQSAQEYINRAIDLKYQDRIDQINIAEKQLDLIKGMLDKEEMQIAEAWKMKYAEEQQSIAEQKDMEKQIQSIMVEAASVGADNATLAKIQSSTNIGDAIRNAGPFLSAEFKMKQAQVEFEQWLQLEQLGLDRMKLEQQMEELELDPMQLKAYAQQYAATGKIPTGMPEGAFGLVANAAAGLPKQPGTIVDVNTGVKPDIADARLDGVAALYDLTKKVKEARELFSTFSTGADAALWNKIKPTTENTRYNTLKKEIVDLLSRARSGAALTETEISEYSSKLPGRGVRAFGTGPKGIDLLEGLEKSINDKLKTTLTANGIDIVGYGEEIDRAAEFDEDFKNVGADTNPGSQATKPGFQPLNRFPMLKELPLLKPIQTIYPQGKTGGQCVTFLHKIAQFPSIGDGKLEKFKSVDKFGIPAAKWRTQAQVGDIVITGENKTYGHGYMINKLLPGGKAQVTESNWKNDEKVTHTRIVDLNSPTIYGAIRPSKYKV